MDDKVSMLEQEISKLHDELEKRGINSRGTTDIFGRPFELPVNAEHKATVFTVSTLMSVSQPHMRVFWAATFGFFCTFFSVFAPASLGPYLKKPWVDGGLDLSKDELSLAGNLAVSGTIVMRVLAGPMCDMWGARKTFVLLLLSAIPGMIVLMTAQGAASFILGRFILGLSLATFVTCQVWCSQFFERRIVGTVNATAGGWGNVGGGITLLVMPHIMDAMLSAYGEDEDCVRGKETNGCKSPGAAVNWAWRMCFLVPLGMHLLAACFCLTGRDLADGSYAELETSGAKKKTGSGKTSGGFILAKVGFTNTNALIMMLTYGLCFGVELTMNNKLTLFFNRYYAKPPREASTLGATFSLMNLFARSWGGILSDQVAVKFGIRGRVAAMWVIQTLEGMMCIFLGLVTVNKLSPDDRSLYGAPKVPAVWIDETSFLDPVQYTINGTMLKPCASNYMIAPKWVECPMSEWVPYSPYGCRMPVKGRITVKDINPECIHNGNTLGVTMILIIVFSLFVQMAEGLHFGVVPYISRPALGVVSGMVGAGGNLGATISGQFIVGSGKYNPLDRGFIYLGIIIISLSMLMHCIFFPGEGGILLPASFPYDPQWIKPPANAQGSDQLDFKNAQTSDTKGGMKDSSAVSSA